MNIQQLAITHPEAEQTLSRYEKNAGRESDAIREACQAVLNGKMVLDVPDVMARVGDRDALPILAIVKADCQSVLLTLARTTTNYRGNRFLSEGFTIPHAGHTWKETAVAAAPLVPPEIAVSYNLSRHWILWEAEWNRPLNYKDPFLLRRLGHSGIFIIETAWLMTALEMHIASGRLWNP